MSGTPQLVPTPINLTVGGHPFPAAETRLGTTPRGACVVVTDGSAPTMDGVSVMIELASHGYESVVVGLPQLLDGTRGVAYVLAAVEYLASRGRNRDNLGLLGIGAGGRSVLQAAATLEFGAAVNMSPTDGVSANAARVWLRDMAATTVSRTPWLGLFADPDSDTVGPDIDRFTRVMTQSSPVHTQTVTYRHVETDFYRDRGGSLAHAASFEAWQRAVEWFNLQVAPLLTELAKASLSGDVVVTAGRTQQKE